VSGIAPGEPTGGFPAVSGILAGLPGLPGTERADMPTAQLPVIGDALPAVPAVSALPGLAQADLPTAQLPVVGKPAMPLPTPVAMPALPVNAVPAMSTLPLAAVPALPAAMPALPVTDTDSVLPADTASLADTAAKLQALFGQLPSAASLPIG
jgi:hypothetical protein